MLEHCEECRDKFEDIYNVGDKVDVSDLTWYHQQTKEIDIQSRADK